MFEENRGQWESEVLYKAASANGAVFFTRDGVTFALGVGKQRASIRWSVDQANHNSRPAGQQLSGGVTNYLIGSDPQQWIKGSRLYESIRTENIRPGLDLVFYGTGGKLEYDLILKPGANPEDLSLRFEGATSLQINSAGAIVAQTDAGEVLQAKPVVWQETGKKRVQVSAHYVRRGENRIEIRLGTYDRSLPLTVDPVLSFSTYLGGSTQDSPGGLTTDSAGNIYLCGETLSIDFPTTAGAYHVAGGSTGRAFVTKINSSGTALLYSTFLGGSSYSGAGRIAVDASGDAYVTGSTSSSDFPITPGSFSSQISTYPGTASLFVTKLNALGNSAVYSTTLGQTTVTSVAQLRIDATGSVYIAGSTKGFPVTAGAFQTNIPSNLNYSDAFVAKLNPGGSALLYATYLGGSGDDFVTDFSVSPAGEAYITGQTTSADFPVTASALQNGPLTTFSYNYSGFITRLNANGNGLVFSTYYDGNPYALALDAFQNIYLTGYATTTFTTTTGAYSRVLPFGNSTGVFVSKLNSPATQRLYSTFIGPGNASQLAVDNTGSAIIVGSTYTGFPITAGSLPGQDNGLFVTKVAPNGGGLIYSTIAGPDLNPFPTALALDSSGNAIIAGSTGSYSLPTTPGAIQAKNFTQYAPNGTIFIQKLDLTSPTLCYLSISQSSVTVPVGGGSGLINVTVNSGCPWSATPSRNSNHEVGLTLSSASGVGSGTFAYSITANQSTSALYSQVSVAGSVVQIMQPGIDCTSISFSGIHLYPASAGGGSIYVQIPGPCLYTLTTNSTWIAFAASNYAGSTSVHFNISANGPLYRSDVIYVAGHPFYVNQLGSSAGAAIALPIKVGVMQPQYFAWALDVNNNGLFDAPDRYFSFINAANNIAVVGDWTGDGHTKVGVFNKGFFALDTNGNGIWDPSGGDQFIAFGGVPGEIPIIGDWNGDGRSKIGVYRNGYWILDTNGNGVFDAGDQYFPFGGNPGEQPVLGDWNGDGRTKVGYMFNGAWVLDYNGNGIFDSADKLYNIGYLPGDKAVVGDWSGTHITKIGIYRSGFWVLDYNGNGTYDGPAGGDRFYAFGGNPGEIPMVGDWNGSGTTKVGFYLHGFWCQDYNGNGAWDGQAAGQDRFFAYGGSLQEQPVLGAW